MAGLGFRTVNEMIGRVDALRAAPRASHWKARDVDVAALLARRRRPRTASGCTASMSRTTAWPPRSTTR